MYKQKIEQLLNQGENSGIEFKMPDVRPEVIAKEMVAFANASGGTILIGVADDGALMGIDTHKNYEEWSMNIARNNVIPPINIEYSKVDVKGKTVVALEIPKGKDKPYQTNDFKYLIRVGSTNRVANSSELMRLFQEAGVYHFDQTGVVKTSISDMNFTRLDNYFNQYNISFSEDSNKEQLLINTDILSDQGLVTVAGLMIFGINPQKYIHFGMISFAHFKGNELSDVLIDKQNIEGNLDYQVETALSVIQNNLLTPSVIEGAKRVDTRPMFPAKVFRELLVNAVVHRNYSISGSAIRIFMFGDRIEFISPGKLPNTVTIEKITKGVSYSRNPIILKFMQNMNYIDKLGRGLPMVIAEAKTLGKKVDFEEAGEEFKVILYL